MKPHGWIHSIEVGKSYHRWMAEHRDGLLQYLHGEGVDIGYRGEVKDANPVVTGATGVDMDYPGYDGIHLPFPDESLDFVFSSHMLEHSSNRAEVIRDWWRVVKEDGHIVTIVPHMWLYEKRRSLPSRFNADHRVFFTPSSLLREFEESLEPNAYTVKMLQDCRDGWSPSIPPESHSCGEYQIELVIQKKRTPEWKIQ